MLKKLEVPTGKNVDLLLIVRGLAALAVLYWHISGSNLFTLRHENLSWFITTGKLAVWIFFMLSGYLIGYGFYTEKYKFNTPSILSFYKNRFLRIYPIFFFVYLLTVFVTPEHFSRLADTNFWLREVFALQWNHTYPLNSVFWTLGIEIQFYFFAPFLILLQKKLLGRYAEIIFYLLIMLSVHFYAESIRQPGVTPFDFRHTFGNLAHFQLGIICARYLPNIKRFTQSIKTYQLWLIIAGIIYLVPYMNNSYYRGSIWSIRGMVRANILGALIIILHVYIEQKNFRLSLPLKALTYLGTLSYGMYAWHGFLQNKRILVDNFFLHSLLAISCSFVTYHLVERTMTRLRG